MQRLMLVIGTRPEAIKLAPVLRQLKFSPHIRTSVVKTGQHRELLDPLLASLEIKADIELDVMRSGQSLAQLTARLVEGLGELLADEPPDAVVVQGDTTTAACAALAAFYQHVPVAHVEAGLRTNVADNPFPEEMNRRLVGQLAHWHFAPTQRAVNALRAEGVPADRIQLTGNPVIDNLMWVLERQIGRSAFEGPADRRRVLVTLHRRESQGLVMRDMALALAGIAARGDTQVLLPLHRSPAVRDAVIPVLADRPGVQLVEALDYLDFTATMADADLVLTDSGGVQEEAPSLSKPVLVLRETTERPEAVDAGVAHLVGTDPRAIQQAANHLLDDHDAYQRMARGANPYGDGFAAARIVERVVTDLGCADGAVAASSGRPRTA